LGGCDPDSKTRISSEAGGFAHEGASASLKGFEASFLGRDPKKDNTSEGRVKRAGRETAKKMASVIEGNVEGQLEKEASGLVSGFLG
jgi:hypothetical protein